MDLDTNTAVTNERILETRARREKELRILCRAAKALHPDAVRDLLYAVVIVDGEDGDMVICTGQPRDTVRYILIGAEEEGWQTTQHQSANFSCSTRRAARALNVGGKILDAATLPQRARALQPHMVADPETSCWS